MTGAAGTPPTAAWHGPDLDGFVAAWLGALSSTSPAPLTRTELYELLHGLAERLHEALNSEPFDPADGYRIGADLVTADLAAPETLGHTIHVISTRLLCHLDTTSGAASDRLVELVAAVACGFARAAHDRALDAQESILLAAVTARTEAERALQVSESRFWYAAMHDQLTGLPNRAVFTDRLEQLVTNATTATRVGVCCVDLDGLQAITDSLGHAVADQVLTATAERLRSLSTQPAHLVASLGGAELGILIAATTCAEDATKAADRALAMIAEPIHINGHELPITASIGVVERAAAGSDPTEIMRAAHISMQWSKCDGGARWTLFDHNRSARDVARYRLSAAMPAALRRREFAVHYQPLVDLASGVVVGVEALARWEHPEHGLLTAGRFIDLAEDTGLIASLGNLVLEQACHDAARWSGLGKDAPYVSVNLATRQLRHPGLAAMVAAVLDRTGLAPERLHLELTEHAVIDSDPDTLTALHTLVGLGLRLAIDDFGTGYSNLIRLPDLPIHDLKLDAMLVRRCCPPTGADSAADDFLATVIRLGHALALTITAEGIETAAQAHRLRALGCHTGQGWHFGHPAPADQIGEHILGVRRANA